MRCKVRMFAVIAVVLLALDAGTAPSAQQARPSALALIGGTLIDGSESRPVRNSVVLVRGERIERVGTVDSLPVPEGYERISTEGMTVLPGLWDMHVHLVFVGHPSLQEWLRTYRGELESVIMPAAAQQLLMSGVTSTRDLAAPMEVFNVKRRIDRGELPGPTIYASGPQFTRQAADVAVQAMSLSGPDDARAKTAKSLAGGADVIKFINAEALTPEEMRQIVETAHASGKLVVAHGRNDAEIRRGLEAGVDELEHIGVASPEYPADVMMAIRARVASGRPLYWGPTPGFQLRAAHVQENGEQLDDPAAFRGLSPAMTESIRKALATAKPQAAQDVAIVRRKFDQLREAGVRFVFGTDGGLAGNPHSGAVWQELDAWVRDLGVEPMTAIRYATSLAAEVQAVSRDVGTVTAGKYADIIAVSGDPLRHVDVLRSPSVVIKHGRRYK